MTPAPAAFDAWVHVKGPGRRKWHTCAPDRHGPSGTRRKGKGMTKRTQVAANRTTTDRERHLVHEWRVAQLVCLGIAESVAEVNADYVDWHQIAQLMQRGCPPRLALRIAR
jgi:hypothetical protein